MIKIVLFALISIAILPAKPTVKIKHKYYNISVTSLSTLANTLNEVSPVISGQKVYHAKTISDVKWKFYTLKYQGKCEISQVKIWVNIQYILPRLTNKHATNEVYSVWDKWHNQLVLHEKGHANLAINTAKKIEEKLQKIPQSKSCKKIEQKANRMGEKLLAQLKRANVTYDHKTKHGETQGASLKSYL
jgi:predicted secreted Zn-dependent protease